MKQCQVLELLQDIRLSGDDKYYTRAEILVMARQAGIRVSECSLYRMVNKLSRTNYLEFDMTIGWLSVSYAFRAAKHKISAASRGKRLTINVNSRMREEKNIIEEVENA
jgi:hypothetical protein